MVPDTVVPEALSTAHEHDYIGELKPYHRSMVEGTEDNYSRINEGNRSESDDAAVAAVEGVQEVLCPTAAKLRSDVLMFEVIRSLHDLA